MPTPFLTAKIIEYCLDITERKKAEEALREREEQLELFFSQSLDGFFFMMLDEPVRWDDTVDKDKVMDYVFEHQRITKVNDAMLQQYAATREQFIGLTPNDFYAHNVAHGRDVWTRFFDAGQLHPETEERKLDGTPMWIEGDYICLYDSEGRITGHFGIQREITKEKQAKDEIARLAKFPAENPNPVLRISGCGTVVYGNKPSAPLLKVWGCRVGESLPERWREFALDALSSGQSQQTEVKCDGQIFFLTFAPVTDANYVNVYGLDITKRKQTEVEKDALGKNLESLWGLAQLAEQDLKTLCDYVLKQIAERTASPYVSYGFLSEDESEYIVYSWSPDVMEDCKMQDKPRIFPVEKAGLWAEALRNRAPMIINDYDKHLGKKGFPAGHVPLKRLMVVPVFSQGRITAMAAVANKETEYEEKDIKQLSAFITSAQTIIDRKRAEDDLRKSEEHYRMLAETMNDGLGVLDEKGMYVYVNSKFREMSGYSPGEVVGRHWTDFFDQDAQKIINEQLTERRKGIAEPYELTNTRKDGQKIFLRISPQAVFDEDGSFKGSFAVITDITERKKAEEEIERLAKFPAENPNPVLRIAEDGTILYANSASSPVLETWGRTEGQQLPDDCYKRLEEAVSSGKAYSFEFDCHDGRIFLVALAPVAGQDYVNAYGLDITERKKAEKRLLEDQAKLKAMASKMLLTEERERQHLAVGLHDEVCQKLVLTKLALESSLQLVSDSNVLGSLRIACEGIGQTIEKAESLTFELSNPVLHQFGFVIALEKYLTEEIRKEYGIAYELQSDEQISPLPDEIKNCLYCHEGAAHQCCQACARA